MRKIVVSMYMSLDGVMEEPAWTMPYFNEEVAKFQSDLLFDSEALLLGRVTYEGFAAAWPSMTDEEGFADKMKLLFLTVIFFAVVRLRGFYFWKKSSNLPQWFLQPQTKQLAH